MAYDMQQQQQPQVQPALTAANLPGFAMASAGSRAAIAGAAMEAVAAAARVQDKADKRHNDSHAGPKDCVVCLEAPRSAVLVHGDSCHQVACIRCARKLWARGMPCPVCKAPLQAILKHY